MKEMVTDRDCDIKRETIFLFQEWDNEYARDKRNTGRNERYTDRIR